MSVSRDGEHWKTIGMLSKSGSVACDVPAAMLPADDIWVKFTARHAASELAICRHCKLYGYQYEAAGGRTAAGTRRCHTFRRGLLKTDPQLQV